MIIACSLCQISLCTRKLTSILPGLDGCFEPYPRRCLSCLWLERSCWPPRKLGPADFCRSTNLSHRRLGHFSPSKASLCNSFILECGSANKSHFLEKSRKEYICKKSSSGECASVVGRHTYVIGTGIWSLSAGLVQCSSACFYSVSPLLWPHLSHSLWMPIFKWESSWLTLRTAVRMGVFGFATRITREKLKKTGITNNRLEREKKYQFQFASERFWIQLS